MQQDSNKKKGKGYRVRPASARERLNGRTRRVCSILGLAAVVLASAVVVHSHPRRDLRRQRHHAGFHQRGVEHLG